MLLAAKYVQSTLDRLCILEKAFENAQVSDVFTLSFYLNFFFLESLATHRCGFESCQRLWILSCEEAMQLAYGTLMVLLKCLLMPEIIHEGGLLRSSATSKARKLLYNHYSVGVT